MSDIVKGRVEIALNINKLVDAEIRDERGITKIVIPLNANNITLTEHGSAYLNLVAFPLRENKFGATHVVKQHFPKQLRKKNWETPIIGTVYQSGRLDFNADIDAKKKMDMRIRKQEREREQKYKGLDF